MPSGSATSTPPDVGTRTADVIVNITPVGMAGGPEENDLAFGAETIAKAHTVFDVVALPSETPLITPHALRVSPSSPGPR